MNYLHHDVFTRTIRISGNIKTISRIHIGSGDVEATFEETDSPLIRVTIDGTNLPYIPGSSLKGVFRSTVEAILKSVNEYACLLKRKGPCFQNAKLILEASKMKKYDAIKKAVENYCFACKIFGGPGYFSNIFISDCIPSSSSTISFDVSPGIAINRRSGTTMPGALFTFEHINPNSLFNFQFQVKNLPNYLIGLIFYVIFLINKGVVLIGGKKRAGLGIIEIIIDSIEILTSEGKKCINLKEINSLNLKEYQIEKITNNDFDINLDIESLLNKSAEEFSENIINKFRNVWDLYVKNKEN
ncbi:MAG: CRISPR-associated RAMP protein Csx7 [Candidatus Lokiarchaeia archaeon]